MHRTLQITVPPTITEQLCATLLPLEPVVGLTVQPGSARKPAGDVVTVHVLNRGADDVLRRAQSLIPADRLSITTAELTSLIDPASDEVVVKDRDEAIWEEMASGLRHQGRITPNYLFLMALGGIIAGIGLVSEPVPQAVAFTASAVISPGFDPMAKVPLGLTLGHWRLVGRGLASTLVGYLLLILAAGLAMWAMLLAGETSAAELLSNPEVKHIAHPRFKDLLLSGTAAVAGIVMLLAFRRSFMAGPLIALAIIPAAALIGAALVVGEGDLALGGLERFAIDWAFIIGLGVPVLWLKQRFVHRRSPIV